MKKRKKRELQDGLPPRSDPSYGRLYYQKNKDRLLKMEQDRIALLIKNNPNYYKDQYDPVKAEKYRKNNIKKHEEKQWESRGIRNFSYEKFHSELIKQFGRCEICNQPMIKPQVDHDHETGEYRSLLCMNCNMGYGIFEKHKDRFENYMKKHKGINHGTENH
jgi:hypothetical protein